MEENVNWVQKTYTNVLRHLGPAPADGDETPKAFRARLDAATKRICGMSADEAINEAARRSAQVPSAKDGVPTLHQAMEAAMSIRWNSAYSTLRAQRTQRRRPTPKSNPKFFEDLKVYGRAKFSANGEIVKSSMNKGPDYIEFDATTPRSTDARVSAA